MAKKEGKYAGEFHDALLIYYRGHLDGAKIHGSPFQVRGLPDYLYCADANVFRTTYIGIEAKYIYKFPKHAPVDLDKLLRREQKKRLHKINKFGGLGLQLTIIERARTDRILIVTRPMRNTLNRVSAPVVRKLAGSGSAVSFGTTFLYTVRDPRTNMDIVDRFDLDILKDAFSVRGGYESGV